MKRAMTDFELIRKFPKCHTIHCEHSPELGCFVYAARMVDAYEHSVLKGTDPKKLAKIFSEILVEVA